MCRFLPLLAALCVAFAPAPFPKTTRRTGLASISLRTFQGVWKVVSIESVDEVGAKKPAPWSVNRIRVEGDQLTYLANARQIGRNRIAIDTRKKPAFIDFYSQDHQGSKPFRVGLIKFERGRVILLFYQTSQDNRAKSFEKPPPFWWWVVLEREQ
jgi:uncharacterized protein (TIGR03067 family)